ncbi:hypothetical protein PC123_g4802 [Phytophthora cactorum]|nr:hypothetical protein PC123_g4802 [Phytophthora cactorum]
MATRAALGRVFSSRSNPKSALALSFIEEAEDGAESFDRRCFLSVRGDGEACAAEGRSGRFGSDDDDSSVAKTIGAVLSRRHSLVEGFGNPRGCHQRHDGESGVAGDEQYRLSEPGQPAALRGHGSPRHQQQDHHKELVIPGLATCSHVKHGIKLLGNGSQHLTAKLDIEVSQASESGFKAVEAASGSITSVYHNRLALRALHKRRSSRYPRSRRVKKALANASNSE